MVNRESNVHVVRRADIPAIHTVMEGGREQILGILKEFRRHDKLSAFLPKDFRVALAWVHLDPGQTLEVHVHPVDSMILICRGTVLAFGDCRAELSEGDILLVPHGSRHGFTGTGEDGFWGLSIQFNSRGLYEDLADPWARFLDREEGSAGAALSGVADPLVLLAARNERYVEHFSKHRLFSMVAKGHLAAPKVRERFFDCFQVWSNHFQRMVLARAALSRGPRFEALARSHMDDELGHNRLLEASRAKPVPVWDPVLESLCAWFPWQMMTSGELEKTVLVHLVVEASAIVFYREMAPVFDTGEAREHFAAHTGGVDCHHVQMGVDLLRQVPLQDCEPLLEIQQRGWDVLGSVLGRIADLITL